MNFQFLKAHWDQEPCAYQHYTWIDSFYFKKIVKLSIQAAKPSQEVIDKQHSKIRKIFNKYPRSGTQQNLKLFMVNLNHEFGDGAVSITEYIPGSPTIIESNRRRR